MTKRTSPRCTSWPATNRTSVMCPETRGRSSTELTASIRAVTVRLSVTSLLSPVATVTAGGGGAATVVGCCCILQPDNQSSEKTNQDKRETGDEAEGEAISCIVRILANNQATVNRSK